MSNTEKVHQRRQQPWVPSPSCGRQKSLQSSIPMITRLQSRNLQSFVELAELTVTTEPGCAA
jgi:hypothetical protein